MTARPALLGRSFDSYASLRIPNYRWFITGGLSMTVAMQMSVVVG